MTHELDTVPLNPRNRWLRVSSETAKHYACFLAYLQMGAARSVSLGVKAFENRTEGKVSTNWYIIAKRNEWEARAIAYDEYCLQRSTEKYIDRSERIRRRCDEAAETLLEVCQVSLERTRDRLSMSSEDELNFQQVSATLRSLLDLLGAKESGKQPAQQASLIQQFISQSSETPKTLETLDAGSLVQVFHGQGKTGSK